jgi:glycosyltransferase involved in cell wall biosynthesis
MNSNDHSAENPLFSIITVCFNAAATIERTANSLAGYPRHLLEWVVVDGASRDHTLAVLAQGPYAPDQLLSEPDAGIYDAMNKGVALARGAYLLFLNSDDWLETGVLLRVAEQIAQHPDQDVYFGGLKAYHQPPLFELVYPHGKWPTSMPAFQPASFVKRHLLPGSQWFDLKYRIAADFKFFKQLQLQGCRFFALGFPVTHYSTTGVSANNNTRLAEMQPILISLGYAPWLAILHCRRIAWQEKLLGFFKR